MNAAEIARQLEVAYDIKPGSIRIETIVIYNGERNVNDHRRRRRQLHEGKRGMYVFILHDFVFVHLFSIRV
ncbi:unnamed protein product [Rotaria sp. Silwood2]|nr:unnamed protein product [Rotaria sp. Silwood2]CAF3016876.1 unnamed protein product [Rotaria sp. Silwood2]CAF3130184.1 unnamed protein product [Rotaria sp. Silwood2]